MSAGWTSPQTARRRWKRIWQIVPRDPAQSVRRDRAGFSLTGPVATDQDVVTLEERLMDRLAAAIGIAGLR